MSQIVTSGKSDVVSAKNSIATKLRTIQFTSYCILDVKDYMHGDCRDRQYVRTIYILHDNIKMHKQNIDIGQI